MKACRCIVGGRVQGVGFRYFTLRAADRLGVRGWVRNLPGGEVEIVAEGEPDRLESFLDEVRRGPSFGRVTTLEAAPAEPAGFGDFQIRM